MVSAAKLRRAQERIVSGAAVRAQDAAGPQQPGRRASNPRRTRCSRERADAGGRTLLDRRSPPTGLCGGFNTNIIKARRPRSSSEQRRRRAGRAGPGRPQGPRLLPPPRLRRALRAGRPLQALQVVARAGDRRARSSRSSPRGRGRSGLSRLQRVQERDRRSASSSSGCCRSRGSTAAGAANPAAGPGVDYLYEPSPRGDPRAAPAEARRDPGLPRAARIGGGGARARA